jgi:hypothetical protein
MNSKIYHLLSKITILLGSFLLFQVQPIIAKTIQPWFGSTSSVWSTCMMFFQFALLMGYLYAHGVNGLRMKRQWVLHSALIAAAVALLVWHYFAWGTPITPAQGALNLEAMHPVTAITLLLSLGVGLQFLVLAANSNLVQAWYARVLRDDNAYVLYSVSNVGALASLLSYPFFIERQMGLTSQAYLWSGLFLLYAALMVLLGWRSCRLTAAEPAEGTSGVMSRMHDTSCRLIAAAVPLEDGALRRREGTSGAMSRMHDTSCRLIAAAVPANGASRGSSLLLVPLVWILLAFLGSTFLLSVTNELTQDISPTPFLWVLPLSLYLSTFIVAFSNHFDRWRGWTYAGLLAGAGLAVYGLHAYLSMPIAQSVLLLSLSLFLVCLFCHSRLYEMRPPQSRLTLFYVMISVGGFLGGFYVNIVAPLLFPAYWDVQISLALALALAVGYAFVSSHPAIRKLRYLIALVSLGLCAMLGWTIHKEVREAIFLRRNFYGSLRVEHEARGEGMRTIHRYQLMHGDIVHGIQFSRTRFRYKPTAYFHEESGIGRAILNHPNYRTTDRPFRLGVIGEGIGTFAAYCRTNDYVRFYELNPAVHELAENSSWFTYLKDCKGEYDVVIGDGRLSLEDELVTGGSQPFDVLVADAFNGDAVPVHLLTEEAIAMYLQHLEPENGILAINGTNKHLDFRPLAKAIALRFDLHLRVIATPGDGKITQTALWLLFSRNPDVLNGKVFGPGTLNMASIRPVRLWTDDYSSVFDLLR